MNDDLKAIMARRRKLAEDDDEQSLEGDIVNLQNSRSNLSNGSSRFLASNDSMELHGVSSSKDVGLQAIMERRRRLADGDEEPAPPTPPTHNSAFKLNLAPKRSDAASSPVKTELKSFGMSKDLQSILARRRQLNQSQHEDPPPPPPPPPPASARVRQQLVELEGSSSHSSSLKQASNHSTSLRQSSSHSASQRQSKHQAGLSQRGSTHPTTQSANGSSLKQSSHHSISQSSHSMKQSGGRLKESPHQSMVSSNHSQKSASFHQEEEVPPKVSSPRAPEPRLVKQKSFTQKDLERKPEDKPPVSKMNESVASLSSGGSAEEPRRRRRRTTDAASVDESSDSGENSRRRNESSRVRPNPRQRSIDNHIDNSGERDKNSPRIRRLRSIDHSDDNMSVDTETREIRRSRRRASVTTSAKPENTSLRGLSRKASRRSSTGSRDSSDDYSRADSVSSGLSGSPRRSRRSSTHHAPRDESGVQDADRQRSGRERQQGSPGKASRRRSLSRDGGGDRPRRGGRKPKEDTQSVSAPDDKPKVKTATAPPQTEKSSGWDAGFGANPSFPGDGEKSGNDTAGFGSADPFANAPSFHEKSKVSPTTTSDNAAFGADFSGFPADFSGAAFGEFPSQSAETKGAGGFDAVFDSTGFDKGGAFEDFNSTAFSPPPPPPPKEPTWESTPWNDMPVLEPDRLEISQEPLFTSSATTSGTKSNPLNGNLIYVSKANDGSFFIREVDPKRNGLPVLSVPILTTELQRKVQAKHSNSAYRIRQVLTLAVGLHDFQGQVRCRVAAVLDVDVLEMGRTMRLVAVWQWGYGSPNVASLQHVITPPSGSDFSFDMSSLQLADNLLFLAGNSPKGPCIFMAKPSSRDTWSANLLGGSSKISVISVTKTLSRSCPYLVVGLMDRSLAVWTYQDAIKPQKKGAEASKRWLFPLCRLDSGSVVSGQEACSVTNDDVPDVDTKNIGHCTHISWLPPDILEMPHPVLAASFQNAIVVYQIAMPRRFDRETKTVLPFPAPTSGSLSPETPALLPLSVKRWSGRHDRSMAAWLSLGPLMDPCLVITLHSSTAVKLAVAKISIPLHHGGPTRADRLLPLQILSGMVTGKAESDSFISEIFETVSTEGYVMCQSDGQVCRLTLGAALNMQKNVPLRSLSLPTSSIPFGISSTGDPFQVDVEKDDDGCIALNSMIQTESQLSGKATIVCGRPTRKYFLSCVKPGDLKDFGKEEHKDDRGASDFGGSEIVKGGAVSSLVAELFDERLSGLIPFRITRCKGKRLCAVLYHHLLDKGDASYHAVKIALVDYSVSKAVIQVVEGRDMLFFPNSSTSEGTTGVLLSSDGSSLSFFTWENGGMSLGSSHRPVLGVDTGENFVVSERVFAFDGAGFVGLLISGRKCSDKTTVLVAGNVVPLSGLSPDNWLQLLPNLKTGHVEHFKKHEMIMSVVGLEHDDNGYRNFAVATTSRVLVLSAGLEVIVEANATLSSFSLAPMGSFAACFACHDSIRYLSCLDAPFVEGNVAYLPHGSSRLLLAVRPDRLVYMDVHTRPRLVEFGQSSKDIQLTAAETRPALLLEPILANAICVGGKQGQSTPILKMVVEKYGRKVTSLNHEENEGLGLHGAGLSARSLQMLETYGLKSAWLWLLTGSEKQGKGNSTTILPTWLPMAPKLGIKSRDTYDTALQVLSSGDKYLAEYISDPELASPTLPGVTECSSYLSREYGRSLTHKGDVLGAIKCFDFAGSETDDSILLQLALLRKKGDVDKDAILKTLGGLGDNSVNSSLYSGNASGSLAALAVRLKQSRTGRGVPTMNNTDLNRWMKPLAPSLLRGGTNGSRNRQTILKQTGTGSDANGIPPSSDPLWNVPCSETKHVWNEGPRKAKDKTLMLDTLEDWLGRRRPIILGKEGVSAAKDRGALADILHNDEASFGGISDTESVNDGWVDGVGEGRSDEANLSAYFRLSEGEDEDSHWQNEGFVDLSPYQAKATLIGDSGHYQLEASSSSVDDGEPGKVKCLYDLVFEKMASGSPCGLSLPATRGGSVDIGLLHRSERQARQKCSIEFWYRLPSATTIESDIVLMRRTMGASADDFSKAAVASDSDSILWEVVLRKSGVLQFKSCGGTTLVSCSDNESSMPSGDVEDEPPHNIAQFDKWNHVCLVLNSKGLEISECDVRLYMKGREVVRGMSSFVPPGMSPKELEIQQKVDTLLMKSHVLFGVGGVAGFRLTEIRVWACHRPESDTQSMLYECLTAAESKKKFKVKIKTKKGGSGLAGKGFLAPPSGASKAIGVSKGIISLAPSSKPETSTGLSLAPKTSAPAATEIKAPPTPTFEASFDAFGSSTQSEPAIEKHEQPTEASKPEPEAEAGTSLWDTALPLSEQVRSSAAAAIMRGPPATRHFGGNRGGLPDFSGMDRFGVGGIAICGSEKTIVWRDNEDPPALTYPIGASGAVVSDQMDDEGSEFLCCFLAQERRMVVFELQSRTVVVELQMTTKLNFWRFLPPEADENNLCFMLVTPVGGFHWMPLEESPRPHQVWKRGPELQGKKVVSYEEGGTNGMEEGDILSRVGLVTVTQTSGEGMLEAWIVPISGDSNASQFSDDCMGACFCHPPSYEEGPFLPLLVAVNTAEGNIYVNVVSIQEPKKGSVELGEVQFTVEIDAEGFEGIAHEPPALAMGDLPEAICCSLANILVVIIRRKGLIVAYEVEEDDLSLIASEDVGHFVVDAVMRYSAEVGGAEIVMLLSDTENPKDGRMVSFCFRSAA